jgi:hypothetical protein
MLNYRPSVARRVFRQPVFPATTFFEFLFWRKIKLEGDDVRKNVRLLGTRRPRRPKQTATEASSYPSQQALSHIARS